MKTRILLVKKISKYKITICEVCVALSMSHRRSVWSHDAVQTSDLLNHSAADIPSVWPDSVRTGTYIYKNIIYYTCLAKLWVANSYEYYIICTGTLKSCV